jgi:hypothetical protein
MPLSTPLPCRSHQQGGVETRRSVPTKKPEHLDRRCNEASPGRCKGSVAGRCNPAPGWVQRGLRLSVQFIAYLERTPNERNDVLDEGQASLEAGKYRRVTSLHDPAPGCAPTRIILAPPVQDPCTTLGEAHCTDQRSGLASTSEPAWHRPAAPLHRPAKLPKSADCHCFIGREHVDLRWRLQEVTAE